MGGASPVRAIPRGRYTVMVICQLKLIALSDCKLLGTLLVIRKHKFYIIFVGSNVTNCHSFYPCPQNDFVDPSYILDKNFDSSTAGTQQSIIEWRISWRPRSMVWVLSAHSVCVKIILTRYLLEAVINKTVTPPTGNKHDYLSWAQYVILKLLSAAEFSLPYVEVFGQIILVLVRVTLLSFAQGDWTSNVDGETFLSNLICSLDWIPLLLPWRHVQPGPSSGQ